MKYSFTIICILLLSAVYSQKEDYNWVFSKKTHINFNTNPPTVDTVPNNLANTNCSAISDKNGNLLFYNDLRKIYNSKHQLIFNLGWATGGLFGLVNIVPHPINDKSYFYISGIKIGIGIQFIYLIDMNANAGNGKVTEVSIIDKKKYPTIRFLITRKFNSNNYWFLRFKDNKIIRNTIDASGLKDDTSVEDFMKVSRIKISPDMSNLLITNSESKFYIADYDCRTAEIKNIKQFVEDNYANSKVNSFEFSKNGNYLFHITEKNVTPTINKTIAIKYDMSKINNIQSFINSADTLPIINSTNMQNEHSYDISLAPNGNMYILVGGVNYLFAIEEDNGVSGGYVLNKKSLNLKGNKVQISLPHYFSYHASFNCDIDCNTSTFNYIGMPLQSQQWNFGDGTISTEQNPTHTYIAPGTYTVKLTATYTDGTTQIATKNITVSEKPKKPVILHD